VAQYAALFRGVPQDRLFPFQDLAHGWPVQPADLEIAYAQKGDRFETALGKAMHSSRDIEERDWRRTLPSRYSKRRSGSWSRKS
jgi:hypothetical protein